MSYYATGSGSIAFTNVLDKETYSKVLDILQETLECDGIREPKAGSVLYKMHATYIDIWDNDKYHGDDVETTLREVANIADIKEGEICYSGEDSELWRWIFRDGKWVEESGYVIFASSENSSLADLLTAKLSLSAEQKEQLSSFLEEYSV